MKYKGQVSVETLVAVFAIFFLMVIVLVHISVVNGNAQIFDNSFSEKNECLKLMYAISQLNNEGNGSQISIYLENGFKILSAQKAVQIGEQYCYFLARSNDYEFSGGDFLLKNVDGTIEVEEL